MFISDFNIFNSSALASRNLLPSRAPLACIIFLTRRFSTSWFSFDFLISLKSLKPAILFSISLILSLSLSLFKAFLCSTSSLRAGSLPARSLSRSKYLAFIFFSRSMKSNSNFAYFSTRSIPCKSSSIMSSKSYNFPAEPGLLSSSSFSALKPASSFSFTFDSSI